MALDVGDKMPDSDIKPLLGKSFLIIDDSEDNQILFSRFLKSVGAAVRTAANGQMGLEAFLDSKRLGQLFDGIIMDIRMPIMDGYEATRRLREAGFNGPIIALTAHAVPGEEARCRIAGCSHFLTKPIDRVHFNRTIRGACSNSDAIDRLAEVEL